MHTRAGPFPCAHRPLLKGGGDPVHHKRESGDGNVYALGRRGLDSGEQVDLVLIGGAPIVGKDASSLGAIRVECPVEAACETPGGKEISKEVLPCAVLSCVIPPPLANHHSPASLIGDEGKVLVIERDEVGWEEGTDAGLEELGLRVHTAGHMEQPID